MTKDNKQSKKEEEKVIIARIVAKRYPRYLIEILSSPGDFNITVNASNNRHNLTTSSWSEKLFFRFRSTVVVALAAINERAIRREASHSDQGSSLPHLSSIVNNKLFWTIKRIGHPIKTNTDAIAVAKAQTTKIQYRSILSTLSSDCCRIL